MLDGHLINTVYRADSEIEKIYIFFRSLFPLIIRSPAEQASEKPICGVVNGMKNRDTDLKNQWSKNKPKRS